MILRAAAFSCAALLTACATQPTAPADPVRLQILALNDLHGNLESPGDVMVPDPENPGAHVGVPAGGVEHLATLVAEKRAEAPHTVMVAAGDLIGASPLLSALFHDEPTIESLSEMGLAFAAVGNHEFDEGRDEILRIQHGGCHPQDGCQGPRAFAGAQFRYLAASTIDMRSGETLFPPYAVETFDGVPVAFIGLTLKGTPGLLAPFAREGLAFRDEAETVNALVPPLRAQGVEAIVVLIHEGGESAGVYDGCPQISGPIVDIVEALDPAVDLVVTGHTHNAYLCRIAGRPVTSAGSYGRMLTDIDLTLDRRTGDVVAAQAQNIIVATADYPADPAQTALLADYRRLAEPLMNTVVGAVSAPLTRSTDQSEESTLGDVIADAMLEAAPDAQIAVMNPGGIRADITGGPDGAVTFNDLFAAQPFGNTLTTLTMTGAQIAQMLEQQFQGEAYFRILQVSDGFSYRWGPDAPLGQRILAGTIMLNGSPLAPDADYRVVTNNFLAAGGDGFTVFEAARDPVAGVVDVDALRAYFEAHSPIAPGPRDRIGIRNN